ncbi:MAG: hypothetical protein R3D98_13450 [Candidatus Krumholzibacteriia bacterium]
MTRKLLQEIAGQYHGDLGGIHGVSHWARVLENGRRLAAGTAADPRVCDLFAVFHDACRRNDGVDHGHGRRGAELARRWRGILFELDDQAMALLADACERHTDGVTAAPLTVQICWDADRLDLLRCGIRPRPEKLATAAARQPALLRWACERAAAHADGEILTTRWRPWLDGAR